MVLLLSNILLRRLLLDKMFAYLHKVLMLKKDLDIDVKAIFVSLLPAPLFSSKPSQ